MATRSLGRLTLDLIARTGGFTGPMDKASRQTKRQMQDMAKQVKAAATAVTALGVAAATAAAAGFVQMTRAGLENIDQQAKLARGLGGTTTALQALDRAAGRAGVSSGELQSATLRLNQRLGQAVIEGGAAADALKRIGLNANDLIRLDIDERMAALSDAMRDAGLNSQQMAFTLRELGIRQSAIVNLMQGGGAAIRESRTAVEELGAAVSDIDAAAVERANDAVAELGIIWQGLQNRFAIEMAPIIEEVASQVTDAVREAGGFGNAISQGMEGAITTVASVLDVLQETRVRIAAIEEGIARWDHVSAQFALNLWSSVGGVLDRLTDKLNGIIDGFNEIAGTDIDPITRFGDGEFMAGVIRNADEASEALWELAWAHHELANQEMPSEKVNRFFENVRRRREEAIKDAQNNPIIPGGIDDDDPAAQKAYQAIQQQIEALQMQARTVGMSSDEAALFKLATEGATESQLALAQAALQTVTAFEEQRTAQEDYRKLLVSLRTDEEQLTEQMRERLAILDAAKISAEEYADAAGRIARQATEEAPEFSGVDAVVGGPFGELNKIDEAQAELEEWYSTQLEMLNTFREERADLMETWDAEELAIKREHEDRLAQIERARQMTQLAAAESVFGDLTDMAKAYAGEQSGIYKAMFAVQKAAAIAQSLIAIQQGIAMAAANPWPMNLAAMASVAAATAGLVSNIMSVNLDGQAHDGIMSVPEDGTWNLKKGERVTTSQTSAKLDATLERIDRQGSGGGGTVVNIIESRERAGERETRTAPDGREEEDIFVADIFGDGRRSQAIQQAFGLQRRGR